MATQKRDEEAYKGYIALKGFFRVTEFWQCTSQERQYLLGGIDAAALEYYSTIPKETLAPHILENISHIFGIYAVLYDLYPSLERASRSLRRTNSMAPFLGESPLTFMCRSVEHLALTHRYFRERQISA